MLKLGRRGTIIETGTLIGGNKFDECTSVDVDRFGFAVVCGNTESLDIGATQFDQTLGGNREGFALRINTAGGPPTLLPIWVAAAMMKK
ncbi:MAG: hypothetical protein IPM69_05685 [Ignavibacteria bacterium]|nr:hypothetical protein [Ignavibacteria bacterium]